MPTKGRTKHFMRTSGSFNRWNHFRNDWLEIIWVKTAGYVSGDEMSLSLAFRFTSRWEPLKVTDNSITISWRGKLLNRFWFVTLWFYAISNQQPVQTGTVLLYFSSHVRKLFHPKVRNWLQNHLFQIVTILFMSHHDQLYYMYMKDVCRNTDEYWNLTLKICRQCCELYVTSRRRKVICRWANRHLSPDYYLRSCHLR